MAGAACTQAASRESAGPVAGLRLRRLTQEDVPAVEAHLLGLDVVSRNSRFHCALGDFAVARYARRFDAAADVLFGAIDGGTGRIVALAEARPAGAPQTVEAAVSVHASHRGRGLGRTLLACAVSAAFAQGATAADLRFAPGNVPAARIVTRLGARVRAPGRAVLLA